jgi:hypothetical protein
MAENKDTKFPLQNGLMVNFQAGRWDMNTWQARDRCRSRFNIYIYGAKALTIFSSCVQPRVLDYTVGREGLHGRCFRIPDAPTLGELETLTLADPAQS